MLFARTHISYWCSICFVYSNIRSKLGLGVWKTPTIAHPNLALALGGVDAASMYARS
jgi:hypothetical protein